MMKSLQSITKRSLLALALFSLPVSGFAADFYMQLEFTESAEGEFSQISFNTVHNDLYNQAIDNELVNPEADRQIHFVGEGSEGEDVVLTRFNTGVLLRGFAEGLHGEDSAKHMGIVTFPTAKKKLFLPITDGMNSIKFLADDEYVAEISVREEELVCARSCAEAGEVSAEELSCCIGLNVVESAEGAICSDIGNGICESWEDRETAPNDCSPDIVVETCLDGLELLTCSQLVGSFPLLDGKNVVRRNNNLTANSSVRFTSEGARFSGPRGVLSGGSFAAGAPVTIAVTFDAGRYRGTHGLLSFATGRQSISLGISRSRPFIRFDVREKGLEVNGRAMRRSRALRGKRSGVTYFRGRNSMILARQLTTTGENTLVVSRGAIPDQPGVYKYTMFLNGAEVASATTSFEMDFDEDITPRFFIGRDQTGRVRGDSMIGLVSDVRVFTRTLTDLEREQLFQ